MKASPLFLSRHFAKIHDVVFVNNMEFSQSPQGVFAF